MTKTQKAHQEDSRTTLRELLRPGDTLHTVLRHVSRSGMSRVIDVYRLHEGEADWLSFHVARAIGQRLQRVPGKPEGIVVGGCGMDMGFALVYALSSALFPDGFACIGAGCPSNDHSNGDRDYRRGCARVAEHDRYLAGDATGTHWCDGVEHWHKSGGYALRHRWL